VKITKTFDVLYYRMCDENYQPVSTPQFSHKYSEKWELTTWHCPQCGTCEVWEEQGGGDYYVGVQYICTGCAFTFHMPHAGEIVDQYDRQRLDKIRGASSSAEASPSK